MSANLSLWNAVEKTPHDQTKAITGKPYSGNSPKPHWLVRKATETFGPCGIGWGFTVIDERVEPGPGDERLHVARVRVWFMWDGKKGEVEHVGGTPFAGIRSNGKPFMDEDAPKKSVTDALVKALSMLGFAGDIFLGRYDDSKYVQELREEAREASRPAPRLVAQEPPQETADGPGSAGEHLAELIRAARNERELHAVTNAPANLRVYEQLDAGEQDAIALAIDETRGRFQRRSA